MTNANTGLGTFGVNVEELDDVITDTMLTADREDRAHALAWRRKHKCGSPERPHRVDYRDDEMGWTNCSECFEPINNVNGEPITRCVVTSMHGRCVLPRGHADYHYSYGIHWK